MLILRPSELDRRKDEMETKSRRGLQQQSVGTNIKRLCGMWLIRQEEVAEAVGLSKQGLHNIAADRSSPSMRNAQAIAHFFGVPVDALSAPPRDCLQAAVDAYDDAPVGLWLAQKEV